MMWRHRRQDPEHSRRVFGKWKGKVVSSKDESGRGRLQVTVPDLLGAQTVWADPCVPFAGKGVGLYLIPPDGANVWVEFAGGDTASPIWSGAFWDEGECPVPPGLDAVDPAVKHLRTAAASVALRDSDGVIEIRTVTDQADKVVTLTLDPDGAVTVKTGASVVTVSGDAVEIRTGAEAPVLRMDKDVVHLATKQASLDVNASDVTQKGGSNTGVVGENGIELTAGAAKASLAHGNVAIKGSAVDLNDGALEVR